VIAPLPPGSTVGIIGGGQLGRMLAIAAARLSYRTVILEPQADCPAAQVAGRHIVAAYDDADALAELAAQSDVVTYEFENVPVAAADRLAAKVALYPPAKALSVAQDRLAEKTFLNGIGIATAGFVAVDGEDDLVAGLERFGGNGVLKTRRLGYDGKGQRLFRDIEPASARGGYADLGGVPLILESLVDFACEVSVVAARGRDGALAAYEPARNLHREGILRSSTLPASLSLKAEEAARSIAFSILRALDYVGVIGVEFFVLANGGILVNEIAPRVHNSGHWTEAACAISQFEQHIRAVAGLPLGDTFRHSDCVMENLIGDEVARAPRLAAEKGVVLNPYGKHEVRAGRKMGHFTRLLPR
jgi:5-(carboxyamino)imidazole ribonucleotide synthase